MAASQLKRVSASTESAVSTMADRESRTFVAQLDIVVEAGLKALGMGPDGTPATTPRKRAARKPAAASA